MLVFHFSADNQGLPAWLLAPAFALSVLVPAVLLLESRRSRPQQSEDTAFPYPRLFLLLLVLGQVGLTFLVSQVSPVYIIRALLPGALAYYGLVAALLFAPQTPRLVRWGIGGAALLTAVLALGFHYQYADFPRAPFVEAADYLRAGVQDGTQIVHSNKMSYFPLHNLDRALPGAFVADAPGSAADTLAPATQAALGIYAAPDLETAVGDADHLYFVIFLQEMEEFAAAPHPSLVWLEGHYTETDRRAINDLLIIEYVSDT